MQHKMKKVVLPSLLILTLAINSIAFAKEFIHWRTALSNQNELAEIEKAGYLVERDSTQNYKVSYHENGASKILYLPQSANLEVEIATYVHLDEKQNEYAYYYTVLNREESRQEMSSLAIEAEGKIKKVTSQKGWDLKPTKSSSTLWWQSEKDMSLTPGQIAGGFTMTTPVTSAAKFIRKSDTKSSLPGIVRCIAKGENPTIKIPRDLPTDLHAQLQNYLNNTAEGKVIAPVGIPEKNTALAITQRLLTYLEDARLQGWINSKNHYDRLEKHLTNLEGLITDNDKDKDKISKVMEKLDITVKEAALFNTIVPDYQTLMQHNLKFLKEYIEAKKQLGKV